MNILFISLGCDKNLVDSEVMLGLLDKKGYQIVDSEEDADIIVVNTCCFIHDAKEESIQTILEMAEYKKEGKLKAVVTQNIDGLHQKAGSSNVIELHGSVLRNYCERCHKFYGIDKIINSEGVPMCDCGGRIKPDVVLYEEGLDDNNITNAVNYIRHADMLIIGGTSLGVYPAAGLIDYYRGDKLVLINKSATPFDNRADILINAPLADVFKNFM